jgi:hypothetical protein
MLNFITRSASSIRARCRWLQGRCPACSRKVNAVFTNYRPDPPHCICLGETLCNQQLWTKYENAMASTVLIPFAVKPGHTVNDHQQRVSPPVLIAKDQRSSGRVTLRQTDKADVRYWEEEGGSLSSQPLKPMNS